MAPARANAASPTPGAPTGPDETAPPRARHVAPRGRGRSTRGRVEWRDRRSRPLFRRWAHPGSAHRPEDQDLASATGTASTRYGRAPGTAPSERDADRANPRTKPEAIIARVPSGGHQCGEPRVRRRRQDQAETGTEQRPPPANPPLPATGVRSGRATGLRGPAGHLQRAARPASGARSRPTVLEAAVIRSRGGTSQRGRRARPRPSRAVDARAQRGGQEQDRPQEVELLLDRQRPDNEAAARRRRARSSRWRRAAKRTFASDSWRPGRRRRSDGRSSGERTSCAVSERRREHERRGREDASGAAGIEAGQGGSVPCAHARSRAGR